MKRGIILLLSLALGGCAADQPLGSMGHREAGALIGAVGGAVVGAVAYDRNRTKGAVVGAVGGALAGGAVGRYMDDQKRDLEKNLASEIKLGQARVDKLPNDVVRITMTSQTAFETTRRTSSRASTARWTKWPRSWFAMARPPLRVVGHNRRCRHERVQPIPV